MQNLVQLLKEDMKEEKGWKMFAGMMRKLSGIMKIIAKIEVKIPEKHADPLEGKPFLHLLILMLILEEEMNV
jgi:hypothetical protein